MECRSEIFNRGGLKVLLVDRDPESVIYMSRILQDHSYQVRVTGLGLVALSMIVKDEFDLVICEIDLPGMDGFELVKQVTSKVDIPIILISASEDTQLASKAAEAGACFFYHKPMARPELVNIWRHYFNYSLAKNKLYKGLNPSEIEKFLDGVHGNGKSSSVLGKRPLSEPLEVVRSSNGSNGTGESSQLRIDNTKDVGVESTSTSSSSKKKERNQRMTWTPQLKERFHEAFEALGNFRATPLKIMELMSIPNLKLHHITSYLQKYRSKRNDQEKQAEAIQNGMTNNPGASTNGMQIPNYNSVLSSERSLGTSPLHTFPGTSQLNPQFNTFSPSYFNIQTAGDVGLGGYVPARNGMQNVWPNYSQTTAAPNMVNFQNTIGLGGSLSGGNPQLLPGLSVGLGVNGYNIGNMSLAQTIPAPNLFNVQNNIGLGGFLSGGNPQLLPELNGGLGMNGYNNDHMSLVQRTEAPNMANVQDNIALGGSVSGGNPQLQELTGSSGMNWDDFEDRILTTEEIESMLQYVNDDNPGRDVSSSGGNVSAGSGTQALTPQIGTVTEGERAIESFIDNMSVEDVNDFIYISSLYE